MKAQRLQYWLQMGGLFGVIASLVFVAMQMRQSHDIALSGIYQERANTSIELKMAPLQSDVLISALAEIQKDGDVRLSAKERLALQHYFWSQLVYLENEHFQFTRGFITDEQWQTNLGDIEDLMTVRVNRDIWDRVQGRWRESFINEVERILDHMDVAGDP